MQGTLSEFEAWCWMTIGICPINEKEERFEQYFKEAKFVYGGGGLIVYWINPNMFKDIPIKEGWK